jgi:1,2-diacylglycerol 3-alpha-glucosyltransferase
MIDHKPLSICHFSDDFFPAETGVGIHVQSVARALARRGAQVTVVTTRRPGQPTEENWNGVRVYRVNSVNMWGFYQALPSRELLRKILTENQVKLVHTHYIGIMLMQAVAVATELKIPHVYTYHMLAEHLTQHWPMRPFRRLIEWLIVSFCNRFKLILSPSEKLGRQIRESGIRTPIQILTNPVAFEESSELDQIGVLENEPESSHESIEKSNNSFRILYAGRLSPEKNIILLLKAYVIFFQNFPDSILWIAGQGPSEKSLRNHCDVLGIAGKVKFLGLLDHKVLANYYKSCDVFVLPSLQETQGLVVMEAMFFGKPTIVTDQIVSAYELVEDNVTGYIVDAFSPLPLAQRLTDLALDSDLRFNMGRSAQAKATSFRLDSVIDRLQKIYSDNL